MVMAATLALIVFMTVFSQLYQDNMSDRKRLLIEDYGYSLQNEFLIARSAKEGYLREFMVPQKLEGYSFDLKNVNGSLALNYTDAVMYFSLPEHAGQLNIGKNNIRNLNGTLCVNC